MSSAQTRPSTYVVILSGTHVTGKETLAISLSDSRNCPWLKAEHCHVSATSGARFQARRGFNYSEVFGRIWFSKLRRMGLLSKSEVELGKKKATAESMRSHGSCKAVITCFAMRRCDRDAIRDVMLVHAIRTIFVVMQITKETLSGRTLGAEEPMLAETIMEAKIADIEKPQVDEEDVVVLDSVRDVDTLFSDSMKMIARQLADV